jgi:hypothetical protein
MDALIANCELIKFACALSSFSCCCCCSRPGYMRPRVNFLRAADEKPLQPHEVQGYKLYWASSALALGRESSPFYVGSLNFNFVILFSPRTLNCQKSHIDGLERQMNDCNRLVFVFSFCWTLGAQLEAVTEL